MTSPRWFAATAAVAALCVCTTSADATEIRDYAVRLQLDASGTAAVTLDLSVVIDTGELVVPLAFADVSRLRVRRVPDDVTVAVTTRDGRSVLVLTAGTSPALRTVSVEFQAAGVMTPMASGEHRLIRHQLLNTQSTPVDRYVVSVVFPEGWRAHAVREGAPRVRLSAVAGADGATFEVTALRQGDVVTMRLEMGPRQRSWGWLIVGLLLAAGYLTSFRDLVTTTGR